MPLISLQVDGAITRQSASKMIQISCTIRDSLRSPEHLKDTRTILTNYLQTLFGHKKRSTTLRISFSEEDVTQQGNYYDCGVFTTMHALYYLFGIQRTAQISRMQLDTRRELWPRMCREAAETAFAPYNTKQAKKKEKAKEEAAKKEKDKAVKKSDALGVEDLDTEEIVEPAKETRRLTATEFEAQRSSGTKLWTQQIGRATRKATKGCIWCAPPSPGLA